MNLQSHSSYEFAPFHLDVRERRLWRGRREIELTKRLFDLLIVMVENHGRLLSIDELMEKAWPKKNVDNASVVVAIGSLRKALEPDEVIETVTGHGYRFTPKVTRVSSQLLPPTPPPPPFGALPINSPFYVERKTDQAFYRALEGRNSIVLLKGARQVGKTSLLARGLQRVRDAGAVVVLTDLQQPSKDAFAGLETFYQSIGTRLAEQLGLKATPQDAWSQFRSANDNFERFMRREVFEKITAPLVWALDETDRLFELHFAGDVFSLFRTWHNQRAYEPEGPWTRLTLAMAYATEAHLFITDLNQSPFNVGTKLVLEDFTPQQTADLNQLYDAPLADEKALLRFTALVGGHPYLAHRGLYELARNGMTPSEFEASAAHDEGLFSDHLRRLLAALRVNAVLCEAVRSVLRGAPQMTKDDFYHLRTAGVLIGDALENARFRCRIYADFLTEHL